MAFGSTLFPAQPYRLFELGWRILISLTQLGLLLLVFWSIVPSTSRTIRHSFTPSCFLCYGSTIRRVVVPSLSRQPGSLAAAEFFTDCLRHREQGFNLDHIYVQSFIVIYLVKLVQKTDDQYTSLVFVFLLVEAQRTTSLSRYRTFCQHCATHALSSCCRGSI
jgi:hypothetical protein